MTFFEMEGYKEGERYPECTVRYTMFKEGVEHLSRGVLKYFFIFLLCSTLVGRTLG